MTEPGMKCTCCKKQKFELKKKSSKLLPQTTIYVCKECLANKYEPRGFVVIAGRSGVDISSYLKPKRYLGEEIAAKELL